MTNPVEHLKRLRNSAERQLKGDEGMRSTRDVADACDLNISTVRRCLQKAVDDGLIEAFDGGASGLSGNVIYWRALASPAST